MASDEAVEKRASAMALRRCSNRCIPSPVWAESVMMLPASGNAGSALEERAAMGGRRSDLVWT